MLALLPAFLALGPISSHNSHPSMAPGQAGSSKIEITRGALLPELNLPDQDIEECVLDATEPDTAHGGYYTLETGPNKTILIRFGQLKRYLAHYSGIAEAELILIPDSESKPILKSAGRLLKPWGQGPALRLTDLLKAPKPSTDPSAKPTATPISDSIAVTWGAATWRDSRYGVSGGRWEVPGARGAGDVAPIPEAKLQMTDEGIVISGLGPAVEAMMKGENDGFALTFDNMGSIYSSSSPAGKPILRITPKATVTSGPNLAVISVREANGSLNGVVRNLGDKPSGPFNVCWSVDGTASIPVEAPSLGAGQSQTFNYGVPAHLDDKDHRRGSVTFAVRPSGLDQNWSDKEFTYYPKGIPIEFDSSIDGKEYPVQMVQFFNEVMMARSRFSASLDGCLERVKIVEKGTSGKAPVQGANLSSMLYAIGAPDLGAAERHVDMNEAPRFYSGPISRFKDLTGGGDTRFDGGLLASTSFPEANFFSPLEFSTPAEPTYLVAPNTVFAFNAALAAGSNRKEAIRAALAMKPAAVALRASDATGRPLANQVLTLTPYPRTAWGGVSALGDQLRTPSMAPLPASLTLTTGEDGVVLLPSSVELPADEMLLVSATKNGITERDGLWGWQINASAQRGAKVAFIDLRFALPGAAPDYSRNLALGRTITDSANRLPAQLAPVLSGEAPGTYQLPSTPDGYLEIDLNRDRTITEIRLTGCWDQFDILVYNTGQKIGDATLWAKELNFKLSNRSRGAARDVVSYRGALAQVRYIRIVNKGAPFASGMTHLEVFGQQASP